MEVTNNTAVWEFMLKGFSGGPKLEITVFVIIIILFSIIVIGNTFLIAIIYTSYSLHSPMYFFLAILSSTEILMNCLVVPKILAIIIAKQTAISKAMCLTQCFLYFVCTSSCFLFLCVMSFDRYVAICHPLRYSTIMRIEFCIQLVSACLVVTVCLLLCPIVVLSYVPYCSHVLDHLLCDSVTLMSIACTHATLLHVTFKLYGLFLSVFILIVPFILIVVSYTLIVSTVLRMPSDTGRQKTFSTCLSHLTMVAIVFGGAIFLEMRPPKYQSVGANKVVGLGNTMLAPLANPLVYTLRNQNMKDAIAAIVKRKRIFN